MSQDPFASTTDLMEPQPTPISGTSSHFVEADDEIDEDNIPGYAQPSPAKPSDPRTPTGNIGSSSGQEHARGGLVRNFGPTSGSLAGQRTETRYTGSDTLEEPVTETIMRDIRAIYHKLLQVFIPGKGSRALLEWDLWGPLVFCLTLAILLSVGAPADQSLGVFTGVFAIVWLGSVVVTINAKLLRGNLSFFQSLCTLGYCIFPIVCASLVSTFVRLIWVRLPVSLAAFGWSVFAATRFLGSTSLPQDRVFLAIYPCFLFFFILAWMTMIQ